MFGIDSLWIILTGAFVAASCALLGTFLVLRRISMLGDAISHAVLPGIAIAFLISNSRSSLFMFAGAVIFGLITTLLVQFLSSKGVQGDAAIGVAFTLLFAIGVILISLYGQHVDLDLDCVLYGEIAYTPFDQLFVGDTAYGPRPIWINGLLLLLNSLTVFFCYKQLKISSFDPALAASLGINVAVMHYLLMLLVSITTVGAFESVGAILVVAMLIIPAATAYLLAKKLHQMLLVAIIAGLLSSILGYLIAVYYDVSIAGAIASSAGGLFILTFLFSPEQGLVSKYLLRKKMTEKIRFEDALLTAWRSSEKAEEKHLQVNSFAENHNISFAQAKGTLNSMVKAGQLKKTGDKMLLTSKGMTQAKELIRRHRLYENYLADIGYQDDHTHAPAHRAEHFLSEGLMEKVVNVVSRSDVDPHGKEIPEK